MQPTLVDRVQNRFGKTEFQHDGRICEDCGDLNLPSGVAPTITANRQRIMDEITAYQLTSMMEGVVERGTASRAVNLPVPIAGKTGTTNESRDAWFVGFSNTIAAGCYIGYDQPRSMGDWATGGGMCAPVFNTFMQQAVAKFGGGAFVVPEGGVFINTDRMSGQRLPDDARGDNVVAEFFREGEEPLFGLVSDGGFTMASDLPVSAARGGAVPRV